MVCNCLKRLDSGFRRNDGKRYFWTFYEAINFDFYKIESMSRFVDFILIIFVRLYV